MGNIGRAPRHRATSKKSELKATEKKPKTPVKNITLNGHVCRYTVFEEPQADLYQIHISGVGLVYFTKKELEAASKRSQSLNKKYRFIP